MTDWGDRPLTTESLADYVRENWPGWREMIARAVLDERKHAYPQLSQLVLRASRAAAANAAEHGDRVLASRIANYYENAGRTFTVARFLAGLPRASANRVAASFEPDIAALTRKRRADAEANLTARASGLPDGTTASAGLKARPWWHGNPVPFTVILHEDGTPDFAVRDDDVVSEVIERRLCNLCGLPLDDVVAFIGDEEAVEALDFEEPPAHIDCSEFALQACPFLSGARRVRANLEGRVRRWRDNRADGWSPWSIVVTRNYRYRTDMVGKAHFDVRAVIRTITREPDAEQGPARPEQPRA
jgi:hypothetical protein